MKPRKTISVYVLLVGILGLSIAGGILTFQIFSAATRTQLTTAQTEAIKPIDGSIDQDIINNLEDRIVITDQEINQLETAPLTGTVPTPSSSPSAEITPAATESAESIIET